MIPLIIEINETLFGVTASLIGTVLLLLIGAVVYFLKAFISQVTELKKIIHEIQLMLAGSDEKMKSFWKQCEIKHNIDNKRFETVESKLDKHGQKISDHDLEIQILKRNG